MSTKDPGTPVNGFAMSWYYNSDCHGKSAWEHQVEAAADARLNLETQITEISKSHWTPTESCPSCSNKKCRRKFSLLDRPHHCRRCGKIFCNPCLQFQRKLNLLANPDPEGKAYKVCQTCFEEGQVQEGQRRRLTEYFQLLRQQGMLASTVTENGKISKSWRQRLDLSAECVRLVQGFKSAIGGSEIKKTLHDLTTLVTIPTWQKSSTWLQENMADSCQMCAAKFGLMKKKLNCRVCGRAICKNCSTKDLLLFVTNDNKGAEPQLAIIRVVGCPEKEPDIALYLRVCNLCQEKISERQISDNATDDEAQEGVDNFIRLENVHNSSVKLEQKADRQLAQYQSVIESLEDNTRRGSTAGTSNIKVLAKAQVDLADFLSQYNVNIQKMKQLKPSTNTQAMLFRNCLKSKCDFYLENQFTFRKLKRELEKSAPEETLQVIQRTVDLNAITSAQLYVRQLTFETLHLCDKYDVCDSIPKLLSSLDEDLEIDAKRCLTLNGEKWEEHACHITTMIKMQMKDHRLIKLSRNQLLLGACDHVIMMLTKRTNEILQQVQIQLEIKSTDKSFQGSKTSLIKTRDFVKELKLVT
ncbi:uncharacterized protein LOC125658676 isoform X2 [Ostrea edulis]|uniref:uncharacterized protein LOC125658676 isoform X2 n=1 Tax=Ostrea edulis TaxID=37623 RepID=UPI0024AF3C51|nr:uncharacterized protein LOC125658676 isoform X2 [Ostrea edulis]